MTFTGALAILRDGVLLAMLAAAVFTDATRGKVYNFITMPALAIGLVISLLASVGSPAQGNWLVELLGRDFLTSLAGIALALGIFGFAYLMGMLGGGDVKLMAAIGAIMGWRFFLEAAVLTACVGAIIAIVILVRRGRIAQGLKNSVTALVAPRRWKKLRECAEPGSAELETIPYTYAIGIGTLLAWILTQ